MLREQGARELRIRLVFNVVRLASLLALLAIVSSLIKQDVTVVHLREMWRDSLLATAAWGAGNRVSARRGRGSPGLAFLPQQDTRIDQKADQFIRANEDSEPRSMVKHSAWFGRRRNREGGSTFSTPSSQARGDVWHSDTWLHPQMVHKLWSEQSTNQSPSIQPSNVRAQKDEINGDNRRGAVHHEKQVASPKRSEPEPDNFSSHPPAASIKQTPIKSLALPEVVQDSVGASTAQEIEEEDFRGLSEQVIRSLQEQRRQNERSRRQGQESGAAAQVMTAVGAVQKVGRVFDASGLQRQFDAAQAAAHAVAASKDERTPGWAEQEGREESWIRRNLTAVTPIVTAPAQPLAPPLAPAAPPPPPPPPLPHGPESAPAPEGESEDEEAAGPKMCHGLVTLTAPQGQIETGEFKPAAGRARAVSGADCRWVFDVPHATALSLTFDNFHLTGEHGHVFVYSGADMVAKNLNVHHALDAASTFHTYTGLEPPRGTLYVPAGEVLIIFQCEAADSGAGFRLSWTSETGDTASGSPGPP